MKISNGAYQRLSTLKEEAHRRVITMEHLNRGSISHAYWEGKEEGLSIALRAIENENV